MKSAIGTLQAGRAIAALAVVFHHAEFATSAFIQKAPTAFTAVASLGYLGVDFFFVLSGFIIFYTNHNKGGPGWVRTYSESRLLRVFIPYLPIGIGLALLYTFLPSLSASDREWGWLSTLMLLPIDGDPSLSVAWTLSHELIFYGLALLFLSSGRPFLMGALWAAAIVAGYVLGVPRDLPTGTLSAVILHPINLEFLFGMIAAWAFINGRLVGQFAACALGAAFLVLFFVDGAQREHSVVFGLGLAFIIVAVVRAEQAGRIRVGSVMLLLGNASYTIYLVHNPLLSLLVRVMVSLGVTFWAVGVALGFAASIVAGLLFHLVYERPTLNMARRLIGRGKSAFPESAAGA